MRATFAAFDAIDIDKNGKLNKLDIINSPINRDGISNAHMFGQSLDDIEEGSREDQTEPSVQAAQSVHFFHQICKIL